MRRLALAALAALLIVLGITACGSGGGEDEATAQDAQNRAAIAEYQSWSELRAKWMVREVEALKEEIEKGDRTAARKRYSRARRRYGQVKPFSLAFFEPLDRRIDAHITRYLAVPFIGFHRIEQRLWAERSLPETVVFAKQLLKNVKELQNRIEDKNPTPAEVAYAASLTANKVFSIGMIGREEAWSHIDLVDDYANTEALFYAFFGLKSLLGAKSELVKEIEVQLDLLEAGLNGLRAPSGFPPLQQLSTPQTSGVSGPVLALSPLFEKAEKQLKGASASE